MVDRFDTDSYPSADSYSYTGTDTNPSADSYPYSYPGAYADSNAGVLCVALLWPDQRSDDQRDREL